MHEVLEHVVAAQEVLAGLPIVEALRGEDARHEVLDVDVEIDHAVRHQREPVDVSRSTSATRRGRPRARAARTCTGRRARPSRREGRAGSSAPGGPRSRSRRTGSASAGRGVASLGAAGCRGRRGRNDAGPCRSPRSPRAPAIPSAGRRASNGPTPSVPRSRSGARARRRSCDARRTAPEEADVSSRSWLSACARRLEVAPEQVLRRAAPRRTSPVETCTTPFRYGRTISRIAAAGGSRLCVASIRISPNSSTSCSYSWRIKPWKRANDTVGVGC